MDQTVDSIEGRVQRLLESSEGNFNAWMLLITKIENTSPDDIQNICLVYDSFLSEFPLCYGYWIRYAGHKARLCTLNEVEEVYERAVKVASHSVHLWVSYCNFGILSFEDHAEVRRLFERGLSYVAKDYLCHLLWDKYIEFEYSQKNWTALACIYINTLSFPSRRLLNYYESFKKLVALLEEHMGLKNAMSTPLEVVPDYEMACMKSCEYGEVSNAVDLLSQGLAGPEVLRNFFSIGVLMFHQSSKLDKSIRCFEAHIKRHHFHMEPLDEIQLENWHRYLTFVEKHGNFEWTVKLYERCLIPCANYSEFWIRYVDFVDVKGGREIANDALERALKVFLKRIPAFHQYYSMFKEKNGDAVTCLPFLRNGEDSAIDVIESVSRKANMKKRMGDIEAAQEIYDEAIKMAHEKQNLKILSLLYISLARFTFVVTRSVDATNEVFMKGIQQYPSKLIIEGFLDFITVHGGTNHIDAVECKMASLMSPESETSQALSSHDLEEISQLYLKFVDLYGTIHEIRKAWERHMKLFPHIMRPSTFCDHSSNEFLDQGKNINGSRCVPTNSPNRSGENPSKTVSVKHLVENPALMNKPTNIPEMVLNWDQKPCGKADIWMKRQESMAVEAVTVQKQPIPERSKVDTVNNFFNDTRNLAQVPDAASEFHETGIPVQLCVKEESNGDIESPALDNLSISHDNSTQGVTSNKNRNKPVDDSEVSLVHSSPNKNLNCESDSQEKPQEDKSLSLSATHAASTVTKTDLQPKFQETINRNQPLPGIADYPQTFSDGGQWAQAYRGVQDFADPNSMVHGYNQSSQPQQWQAHSHMQKQTDGSNLQMSVTQSYASQSPSLMNSQDPQSNHNQLQYQLAASQAYGNPSLAFLGQHMQRPAIAYTQDQPLQEASSQTQIQSYQSLSQCDGQYGYYQTVQGYPPHIWQYYQNLYYIQQQQMQQRQPQWTDTSQERSSQQVVSTNQEEKGTLQIQPDTQQHRDLDNKQNTTKQQQIQQEKLEELTQSNQQSIQAMNCEQSQLLYLQQQQQFSLQQQQQHQIYLQQQQHQHLLQQQQQQQNQQQHQQLIAFQQQLQYQHQQQMSIPPSQQEQTWCTQKQQTLPLPQRSNELQQENNSFELRDVESDACSQGKGDAVQNAG